ncbi:hypothetical protein [Pseudooceanicola sp. LIPI14-2-Ac024]|uniref:hypothetical protein n=1 Tax=Pseudooceanicola sp. LIPI14-2-Ac024 TaxID=3344875 RepID=UPI0035D0159B
MSPTDRLIQAAAAAILLIVLATIATAHDGPTNSRGCHFSEAEGRHCHDDKKKD